MGKLYRKDVTRELPLLSVKAWHEGDSNELKKWIDFGFSNTIFVSQNGKVTIYYDDEECDAFWDALKEKFTEDLFNKLCEHFFNVINSEKSDSEDEIFEFLVKIGPASTLFDELSKYPEFGTDNMMRRLFRVRKTTQHFIYSVEKKIKNRELKNYIFHKGKLLFVPFEQFIKEKGIGFVE